jgi:non-ribosomal peptide synthetase component F
MDYPKHKCVDQLFEQPATAAPDRVALVCDSRRSTYGELNSHDNQLAGQEVLVGLCIERSPKMLVGMLGILKTAGS